MVKAIIKNNLSFLFPYFIFICGGTILIAVNTKAARHLEFNSFHSPFFDSIFFYITYLGDGVIATLAALILLTVSYRATLIVAVSNIISSGITQLLKHTFFSDVVRPKKFFEGFHDLYLIPGVENHLYNSFPSGHSTCAFSLYFALALLVKNKFLKFALFLTALIVGYSRVYLSQHFFEDVFVGSLIGVSVTGITYFYINGLNKNSLDHSIITFFNKEE